MDVFEIKFRAWSITFYARMDSFHRRKAITPKREANEQNPYAVAIVKETVGCTDRLRIKVVVCTLIGEM